MTQITRSIASAIINSARNVAEMFPGYFGQLKHNYKKDFGWPEHVGFKNFFNMYQRNGLAKAAVHKTATKTWEDWPKLVNDAVDRNNDAEKAVMKHLRKLRVWQKMAEADRRAMVGGYSALVLRFADGLRPDQPVGQITGVTSLVEVIPAWAEQITVAEWDTDVMSETYGHPKMFQFNEMELSENRQISGKVRSFMVHPSRVVIWSSDGTVYGRSILEAGYNDLIDMEKIKGAGGEGFWKNAKAAPVLEVDKEASLREMAAAMGVPESGILEAMNKQVENYAKGFDNVLMVQGITAKPMNVQLSVPESFFMVALMSFAASVETPLKILVGSQSGERASTEDAREWAQTINARRVNYIFPLIEAFIERLTEANVLVGDWTVSWTDLTKATVAEKLELAIKMSSINQKTDVKKIGEVVFTRGEIRQAVDYNAEPEGGFPEVKDTTVEDGTGEEDETGGQLPDEGLEETQKVEVTE